MEQTEEAAKNIEVATESALMKLLSCREWAYGFSLDKRMPQKKHFEALQEAGYLPKTKSSEGCGTWDVTYGHYGWHVDYDWVKIAAAVLAATPPLTADELKGFHWDCMMHCPVSPTSDIAIYTLGKIDQKAIEKLIKALELVKDGYAV